MRTVNPTKLEIKIGLRPYCMRLTSISLELLGGKRYGTDHFGEGAPDQKSEEGAQDEE